MLERYLINTLQNHENNFSEALDPNWNNASRSLMGEHELMKPATLHDVRALATSIIASKACAPWPVAPLLDMRLMASNSIAIMPPLTAFTNGNMAASTHLQPLTTPSGPVTHIPPPPPPSDSPSVEQRERAPAPPLPATGAYIPDLKPREWKRAITQWHEGEPALGLKALKLWDPEMYQGRMKNKVATKRQNRQLVAEEYEL